MAVIGGTVTDDALFGIPAPDYSDTEESDAGTSCKQRLSATLSSESTRACSPAKLALAETNEGVAEKGLGQGHDKQSLKDQELGIPRPDYASDDDDVKKSHEVTNKTNEVTGDDVKHSGSRLASDSLSPTSPDVRLLSPDGEVSSLSLSDNQDRGSFGRSGSRSPIGPIMGVSHEHAAVDPVLIEAKKVPNVPQLTKEQKELQKELQFKQKQGIMLEKKPELKKVMDDRKFKMKKEELKQEQENKQSTFNVKLGKQALKLLQQEEEAAKKSVSKTNSTPGDQQLDEFRKVHSKIHKNKLTT